jgi:hypothetical protein
MEGEAVAPQLFSPSKWQFHSDLSECVCFSATGGIDAYLEAYPGELNTTNKWQMSEADMAGPDLSDLVNGVDTRQAGQRFY